MAVVDEDVAKYWHENLFKQVGVVVGIGDHSIVASFPTPSTESESGDPEWVAEHAMQVSRMLVGGLHVRGVYLVEKDDKWTIATALEESGNLYYIQNGLLQLLVAPDKYLCKRVNQSNKEQELAVKIQPATLKQLYTLTTTFSLSLTIPLPNDSQKLVQNTLQKFVDSSVTQLSSRLKKTIALLDGKSYPLSPLPPSSPSPSTTRLSTLGPGLQHTVTLLTPVMGNICSEEGKGEIGRFVEVRGNIVGVAVGTSESSLEEILDYLAGDLCATLRTRLNLMCETDALTPELPSRIVARVPISRSKPAAPNSVLLCDYVTSDESVRETEERFKDLLALALPKSSSVDGISIGLILREDSTPLVQLQNAQATSSQQSSTQKKSENQTQIANQQKSFFLPVVVAVVVALAGVLVLLMQK